MRILMCGLDHGTAELSVRERLAFGDAALDAGLSALAASPDVLEGAILSTCNRTEIYAVVTTEEAGRQALRCFALAAGGLTPEEFDQHARFRLEAEAVAHLFRVAAGLESQILGEGQILAQVKDAQAAARRHRTLGALLDPIFRFAIASGKRVRTETPIANGAVSVVGAALELARERLGGLAGRRALVLGAGRMGELAAKHLEAAGARQVFIASRTMESAARLAEATGAQALPFHNLAPALADADLVLCCTDAPHHVLGAADLAPVMARRRGRPLMMIDLAMPRNLDPELAGRAGVELFDLDALEAIADSHRRARQELVAQAQGILDEEMAAYQLWRRGMPLNPAIASLRSKFTSVRDQELERFTARHAARFTPEQLALVEGLGRSMINKLLHEPLTQLKGTHVEERQPMLRALTHLYALDVEGYGEYYRRRSDERRGTAARLGA
ncbi:MAG: glutamyl-tRNA reductase [Cyanobacteria bacterium RYN_339]|nr:glutamyl-tRNA reductase [Cyanobacteria bacterium RYN_339]